MTKVIAAGFSISIDGYGAGVEQSLENPLGKGGGGLHGWFRETRAFRQMIGQEGGSTGIDNDYGVRSMEGFGAFILGRNMFGPSRGHWQNDDWKGWWGDNPPYHAPTLILTQYPRAPIVMEGGTTFYFVTGGIEEALALAKDSAEGRNVKIGGGVSTLRQYLEARLIDEVHFAVSPVFLGDGEAVFTGLDLPALGYEVAKHESTPQAMHVTWIRT